MRAQTAMHDPVASSQAVGAVITMGTYNATVALFKCVSCKADPMVLVWVGQDGLRAWPLGNSRQLLKCTIFHMSETKFLCQNYQYKSEHTIV